MPSVWGSVPEYGRCETKPALIEGGPRRATAWRKRTPRSALAVLR